MVSLTPAHIRLRASRVERETSPAASGTELFGVVVEMVTKPLGFRPSSPGCEPPRTLGCTVRTTPFREGAVKIDNCSRVQGQYQPQCASDEGKAISVTCSRDLACNSAVSLLVRATPNPVGDRPTSRQRAYRNAVQVAESVEENLRGQTDLTPTGV